ncbi:NAD(P)-dependent oxidoreductase [Microbacterium paludicola]|uniref:NAD-dependent epimerase/dehydratase family protein n=1 Tax=Microbacterium paludicola TaxID=300019 RepID=UPI0011A8BFD4|nr:NAD(P)-dependent oxidoreductase [Microbacterium paludicola]
MKIFIAGATGAIGSRLVPLLAAAGHDVIGTSRTPAGAQRVDTAGGTGIVMDALDPGSVHREVLDARPDVLVHELTALGDGIDLKHLDQAFARTNELRTRGTDLLLSAADEAGVGRVLVQSFTGWPNARTGAAVKTEEDPLDPTPIAGSRGTHSALVHAEEATLAAGGLVLRYGPLYSPGQAIGEGGEMLRLVRDRRLPIVGGGGGVWSFIHVGDAASATAAAVTHGPSGLYNIVDDEPAAVAEWLPELARIVGARPPLRVPAWVARPMIGVFGVTWMTASRGSSNEKAKALLEWSPRYSSWREGFRSGLGETPSRHSASRSKPTD